MISFGELPVGTIFNDRRNCGCTFRVVRQTRDVTHLEVILFDEDCQDAVEAKLCSTLSRLEFTGDVDYLATALAK